MELLPFHFTELLPGLFVYRGAVNTGILKWGERAVLIDCDDTLTPARLEELGIRAVERIYCTQHSLCFIYRGANQFPHLYDLIA